MREHGRFALFNYGFRPFFLLCGLFAVVMIPAWMIRLVYPTAHFGALPVMYWHAHEMLYGFVMAAIAGFLLTAVPSWTGARGFAGAPLIAAVVVWLAGRVAISTTNEIPSWLLVLAEKCVVNNTLVQLGLIAEPIQLANTRFATVTGFVHFFVMLLTLTIYANLKQLSPSYRKAAADLGAGPIQTFIHVILPLTLPGIMVGAFLTFVLAIGDYITPQILGGNNELLMPQLIMLQIGRRGDFPLASALSILLMAVVTAAYIACARWLKIERA